MNAMARTLTLTDAVRLLSGPAAVAVDTGAATRSAADRKTFVERVRRLVDESVKRGRAFSRFERTQFFTAVHTVLVGVAFVESLTGIGVPILPGMYRSADLEALTALLDSAGRLMRRPEQDPASFEAELEVYYRALAERMRQLLGGTAEWEQIDASERAAVTRRLENAPEQAVSRYRQSFERLAAEVPEFAFWAGRREFRQPRSSLAGLEQALRNLSTGGHPDQRRAALFRAYRAALDRPIAESADLPAGISIPALGDAYLAPRFQVAEASPGTPISNESWWTQQPIREDFETFLAGHLTSPAAVNAPLLVLGQPGAGKSVLTRVLAARLPAADFLTIRVVLRQVSVTEDLQGQIEQAVRQAIGEYVAWPDLARSAHDALPVILLDGFDELLQTIGVSQTDYLTRVAAFQRREADLGRAVAVVVTTRTAVADRARTPEGTVALRLEPFDDDRVTRWLEVWNRTNAGAFASHGLSPVEPRTVLAFPDLATQPLLLFMLVLYDADGNALRRLGSGLATRDLYERLLRSFVAQEVTKQSGHLPAEAADRAVEEELYWLSVTAFAMFNRASQWVAEVDLESDLRALGIGDPRDSRAEFRMPLTAAELMVGKFFFIHQARASEDLANRQTYEFLHATFSEFLVARLIWQLLQDMAYQERPVGPRSRPPDDDLLRTLLSYQPISNRSPVVEFLRDAAASAAPAERESVRAVLLSLFATVNYPAPKARFAGYRPQPQPEPARYAAYAANLFLLSLCTGPVHSGQLYPGHREPLEAWRAQTLLWHSQLSVDGWRGLVDSLSAERVAEDHRREIRISLADRPAIPADDLGWTVETSPAALFRAVDVDPGRLAREAHLRCDPADDVVQHALRPLTDRLPPSLNTFGPGVRSAARALIELCVSPSPDVYRAATALAAENLPGWSDDEQLHFRHLLLSRLGTGEGADPHVAVAVLETLAGRPAGLEPADDILRCVLAFLGRDRAADLRLARLAGAVLAVGFDAVDPVLAADVLARAHEHGIPAPAEPDDHERRRLVERIAPLRPDLLPRLDAALAE